MSARKPPGGFAVQLDEAQQAVFIKKFNGEPLPPLLRNMGPPSPPKPLWWRMQDRARRRLAEALHGVAKRVHRAAVPDWEDVW